MGERSGAGLVELAVLETLQALTAGRPRAHVISTQALAGIEERIGLGPRYGYEVLADLARPWIVPARLVAGMGNFGDRAFADAAGPEYTECRPSSAGQLVLDAEAHRLAPVPVGLINGTTYRGGTQPPLEPFRVLAALRRLLDDSRVTDAELLSLVGPPCPVAGCDITGDLSALVKGRRATVRQTGRITITGVPVPEAAADRPAPGGASGWAVSAGPRPSPPAHLIIESLPARTSTAAATSAIAGHAFSRRGDDPASRPALPIAGIDDQSAEYQVRIGLTLLPGSDPAAVRQQLAALDGITAEATWAFPAPLPTMLRSWVDRHRAEDVTASLNRLQQAIRHDRRRQG